MSAATARTHVSRAMIKLGARDRAQLVVFAYETGLVRPGWHGVTSLRADVGGDRTSGRRRPRSAGPWTMTHTQPCPSRAHQAVRRPNRGRPPRHRAPARRRRRVHRPERRRQDHDHGDAARSRSTHRRHGTRARRVDRRSWRVPPPGRRAGREPGLLSVADRCREPRASSPRSAATRPSGDPPVLDDRRPRRARPTTATAPTRSA